MFQLFNYLKPKGFPECFPMIFAGFFDLTAQAANIFALQPFHLCACVFFFGAPSEPSAPTSPLSTLLRHLRRPARQRWFCLMQKVAPAF